MSEIIKNNQFYILRHGETEYLTVKKHRTYPLKGSLSSVAITKKGRKDIRKIVPEIEKKEIDLIYSSDFLRAKQTALIVARGIKLPRKSLFFNKELRDMNLGIYHGKLRSEVSNDLGEIPQDFNQKPEKGECLNDVLKRMIDFIREIDKKHKEKNVLIVSHGSPLWLLENTVKKRKKSDMINEEFQKNNYIQAGEFRKLN